ncbi:class I SAM-dependent methyltransferase [Nocardia altamirensis]|uniref:class I SAM-dependent methyltransferase n=1 Tax=Nocardia altamirensis TaxID=472158 RepID=UPI000A016FF5|nr:class I SAM-dependent methyltransferase [Nocardia altamirensis]
MSTEPSAPRMTIEDPYRASRVLNSSPDSRTGTGGPQPIVEGTRRGFNRGVAAFFDVAARAYDLGSLQRVVYQPPQDEMIDFLRANGARRIVDIGCGTGILTTRIARDLRPEAVYGIDMSPGMLARARRRSAEVQWRNEPAEQLGLAAESVDAVVTTTAFHFFNQPAALAEFHRVLTPGGLLAISALNLRSRWSAPVQRLSGTRLSPAATPSPQQMRDLIATAGFELIAQRPVRRPWYSRTVPDVITMAQRR